MLWFAVQGDADCECTGTRYRSTVLKYGVILINVKTTRTIGKLASCVGVNVETIRYYHRRGLLKQPRKPAVGARHYDDEALQIVQFIKQAQGLGFRLDEIQGLLSLRRSTSAAVCARVHCKAKTKVVQIDEKIRALQRMRDVLVELTDVCPLDGVERCSILRALDVGDGF